MGNKNYTLTKRDKSYLLGVGYLESDLSWIEKDVNETMCYIYCHSNGKEETITRERAIKLVGKHGWLSSVARACFHASSARETKGSPSGKASVYFDNHEAFRHATVL